MSDLFWVLVYLAGIAAGTGIGARVFYDIERRQRPSDKPLAVYQMAALEGAVCGMLWPVALPLLLVFGVGWTAVRLCAPKEVKREVERFNVAMTERALELDRQITDKMTLALPAGCGSCMWAADRSIIITPGCPRHDPDGILLLESDRRGFA